MRYQRLFAKGLRSGWFEVRQDDGALTGDSAFTSDHVLAGEDAFPGELTAWLNKGNELRRYTSRRLVYAY